MGKRRGRDAEFTVLDAIVLSILPEKHRISATAASIITAGEGFPMPTPEAAKYAALLTSSAEEAEEFINDVLDELRRQLQIKLKRMDERRSLKRDVAMGSELDLTTRINRVCRRIFGDPTRWSPVGRLRPEVTKPHYEWLHRDPEGVLVASVSVQIGPFDDLAAGFVYCDKGGPVQFVRLPTQARGLKELYTLLGLHPRLLGSQTKIDWGKRAFIVSERNHLPWVYR